MAVAGKHVTLAITSPHVSPPGENLQMDAYDSSGNNVDGTAVFGSGLTEVDYTPTSTEVGTTTVIISPYNGGTGSFTLTYTRG
jgi:hypothetical protein